jgi:hypothetical protein
MKYLTILLLVFLATATALHAQTAYPQYDTAHGLVVFVDTDYLVKADTAMIIRKAGHSVAQEMHLIDPGFSASEYKLDRPYFQDDQIILVRSGRKIPLQRRIMIIYPNADQPKITSAL